MMKIGDRVVCKPEKIVEYDPTGKRAGSQVQTGTVVYVHPKGRFVTVGFATPGGMLRESFFPRNVATAKAELPAPRRKRRK